MRLTTVVAIKTALLVVMLSGCGVGGGIIPNGSGSAQVGAATFWGSPGGNPGNTRLSNNIGPQTNELGWSTFRETGFSSSAKVTPDGTVVVEAGQTLIGFNPDGSIRWRMPSLVAMRRIFMSDDGTICYQYDRTNFRLVSQDGTLILEYEPDFFSAALLGFGPEGTIYLTVKKRIRTDQLLVAINAQGELLFEKASEHLTGFLALPGGLMAYFSAPRVISVLDLAGNELWSDTQDELVLSTTLLGSDHIIYVLNSAFRPDDVISYISYSLDGTRHELVEPGLPEGEFRMAAVASSGDTVWRGRYDGQIVVLDPDGSIVWQYNGGETVSPEISLGSNGEVYTTFRTKNDGINQWNLLGFNSAGEIIHSQTFENYGNALLVPGEQGAVYYFSNDEFSAYDSNGDLAWSYDFGGMVRSIAIGPNGTIYSTGDNVLYATSQDGEEQWRYSGPDRLGRVIVAGDGRIYITTTQKILELAIDGSLSREIELEDYGVRDISLSTDGHLFVANNFGITKIFLSDLTHSWEFSAEDYLTTRMAVGEDGTLYFGMNNGLLYAIDSAGQARWTFDMLDRYVNTPAVTGDAIYATSVAGGLFKLGLDGSQIWRFEPVFYCYVPPSIGPDGTVYFGTSSRSTPVLNNLPSSFSAAGAIGMKVQPPMPRDPSRIDNDPVLLDLLGVGQGLYAISSDGAMKWNLHTSSGINYPVCVDKASNIFLGMSGQLFSLNPNGTERWRFNTELSTDTDLSIGSDGSIIFGSRNYLFSIGPGR